jgi:hypothetical protein
MAVRRSLQDLDLGTKTLVHSVNQRGPIAGTLRCRMRAERHNYERANNIVDYRAVVHGEVRDSRNTLRNLGRTFAANEDKHEVNTT